MAGTTWKTLSRMSASFVQDEETPKAYECTKGRQVGRISVTAFALLVFIALAGVLLYCVPAARIDRNWPGSRNFTFTTKDMSDFSDGSTRLCPCGTMATSWTHYVSFFPLVKDPSNGRIIREAKITDGESFCDGSTNFNSTTGNDMGCALMFNSVVNKDVAQTWFPTAYVLLPSQLKESIHKKIQANLNEILWNYMISNRNNNLKAQRELYDLWSAALDQFFPHTSSDTDFWRAAESANVLDVMSSHQQMALGMEISWPTYANACNPPYCDQVKQNTVLYRFFLILVQVGGLSTVVLLSVRLIIWPVIRKGFNWPAETHKPLDDGKEQAPTCSQAKVQPFTGEDAEDRGQSP